MTFVLYLQRLYWIVQCFTSPPTQYRLYGRRFLQVKRPNQQHQSTEGTNSTQTNQTYNKQTWTQNTASPLVYNNMEWLRDGSHREQVRQAWTAVGLPPWYPRISKDNKTVWANGERGLSTPGGSDVQGGSQPFIISGAGTKNATKTTYGNRN